jgi:hypothetical protein
MSRTSIGCSFDIYIPPLTPGPGWRTLPAHRHDLIMPSWQEASPQRRLPLTITQVAGHQPPSDCAAVRSGLHPGFAPASSYRYCQGPSVVRVRVALPIQIAEQGDLLASRRSLPGVCAVAPVPARKIGCPGFRLAWRCPVGHPAGAEEPGQHRVITSAGTLWSCRQSTVAAPLGWPARIAWASAMGRVRTGTRAGLAERGWSARRDRWAGTDIAGLMALVTGQRMGQRRR